MAWASFDFNLCSHAVADTIGVGRTLSTTDRFRIVTHGDYPVDLSEFGAHLNDAIEDFATRVAPVTRPVEIEIGAPDRLRTGYSFEKDTVAFVDGADTQNLGLDSPDIIDHEVFHALLCHARPEWCTPAIMADPANRALHEALADFFAYSRRPDQTFGEGFYRQRSGLRAYRNDLVPSLVDGEHAQGIALVAKMIRDGASLKDVKALVAQPTFTDNALFARIVAQKPHLAPCDGDVCPRLAITAADGTSSSLARYRVPPAGAGTFDLKLSTNDSFRAIPDVKYEWTNEKGEPLSLFSIAPGSTPNTFRVTANGATGYEKVTLKIRSGDKEIGLKSIYLAIRRAGAAAANENTPSP